MTARQRELLAQPVLVPGARVDRLVVLKGLREMQAWDGDVLLKKYPVSLGGSPAGHKQFEGDRRTPEGVYRIDGRNPHSAYHKNLGVSYPNAADRAYAARLGRSPGGDIKIHGIRNGLGAWVGQWHLLADWTDGCIAVTNAQMDELFAAVVPGAVVDLRP